MEDSGNKTMKSSYLNSSPSHQADHAQNLSPQACQSSATAGEDDKKKLAKASIPNYSSKEDEVEESLVQHLEQEIQSKLKIVKDNSQRLSVQKIICCVNPLLRKVNAEAYRPNFVIIGPLRKYDSILEEMEMLKRIYLASFLKRAEKKASLNHFSKLIRDSADKIHGCYGETYGRIWDFSAHVIQQKEKVSDSRSRLFIEMVLVDASFIIELFLRAYKKEYKKELQKGETDFIFNTPGKMNDIRRDLFLAHNQLPFFILKSIYEVAFGVDSDYPCFLCLTCHFFSPYYNQNISIEDIMKSNNPNHEYRKKLARAEHLTDFLRTLQMPYTFPKDCDNEKSTCSKIIQWIIKTKIMRFIGLMSTSSVVQQEERLEEGKMQLDEYLYSAVLLRDAGVKFKVSSSRCLLDIEFNRKNGVLKIPSLKLDESTESFFRNLMAWEQRHYSEDTYICDYIFLMQYLITSTEDVDLLIRRRIIINQVGSNTVVVTLFNNFCKHITPGPEEKNRYSDIFRELNAYSAVRHHNWVATLRLQHFSSLWRGVATVAAAVFLVLTLIQTICSILSLV